MADLSADISETIFTVILKVVNIVASERTILWVNLGMTWKANTEIKEKMDIQPFSK